MTRSEPSSPVRRSVRRSLDFVSSYKETLYHTHGVQVLSQDCIPTLQYHQPRYQALSLIDRGSKGEGAWERGGLCCDFTPFLAGCQKSTLLQCRSLFVVARMFFSVAINFFDCTKKLPYLHPAHPVFRRAKRLRSGIFLYIPPPSPTNLRFEHLSARYLKEGFEGYEG